MPTNQVTAGWYPDPSGRHQVRYWDGSSWTDHVADSGMQSFDPPTLSPGQTPGTTPLQTSTAEARVTAVISNAMLIVLAFILFAVSFLDWLGFSAQAGRFEASTATNAWEFAACAAAVIIGVLVTIPAGLRLSRIPVPAIVVVVMGGIAFALALIKFVVGPDIDTTGFDLQIDKTREIGIYLGLVITAAITGVGIFQLVDDGRA